MSYHFKISLVFFGSPYIDPSKKVVIDVRPHLLAHTFLKRAAIVDQHPKLVQKKMLLVQKTQIIAS